MTRVRRTVIVIAIGTAAVAAIAASALLVIATTTFGARLAIDVAAGRLPGELSVGDVDGSLYSGVELRDVRFRNAHVAARFASLSIDPSWRDLADGRYALDRVHIADGRVEIADIALDPPNDRSDGPAGSGGDVAPRFRVPAISPRIVVREVGITNVDVETPGPPIRIGTLRGAVLGGTFEVARIEIGGAGATLVASGGAHLALGRATGQLRGSVTLPSGTADAAPADGDPARRGDPDAAGDAPASTPPRTAQRVDFDASFRLDDDAEDGRSRASLAWSRLEWHGPEGESVVSRDGRIAVRLGPSPALDVALDATLEGDLLPAPASITASAAVSTETVDIRHARIGLGDARALATGAFDVDTRSGYVSVDYAGVDPAFFDAPIDGALDGRIDVAVATSPELTIAGGGRIAGAIADRPLDGRLVASYSNGTLSIERGDLSLDDGRIVVDGLLSRDSADLRFSANVPRIDLWYPPAAGSLTATGTIVGDTDDPRVDIDFDGRHLAWHGAEMPPLERVALRVDGTRSAHALRVDVESAVGHVLVEAEQRYGDGGVDGRLVEMVLDAGDAGVWRLATPGHYSASPDDVLLEPTCVSGPADARICAALDRETLSVTARGVPNALAEPWLPERFVVTGTTDADAEVALSDPHMAAITLHHDRLRIGVRSRDAAAGDPVPLLDLGDVVLRAALDADALSIELAGGSEDEARPPDSPASLLAPSAVAGRLTLSPLATDGRLDGTVSARLTELAPIGALVDGVDALSGRVAAQLAVSGTLESPRVSADVSVTALAAELPALGIAVRDGRLLAGLPENADLATLDAVPFDIELCSTGCARIAGRVVTTGEAGWSLTAIVEGDDVLIVDRPELRAVATPRLDVRATPERAAITGTIAVPEGAIEIDDVPRSAVRPARETVVHGRETPDDETERVPIPLSIDVDASLGNVRFEGLGLDVELAGTLAVERMPGREWNVQGTALVEEGTFGAYGQTLTIEQGLLVFTGPPSDPALDIRATRIVDDAVITLAVTGTAENPRSEVFSEAGLSESEAFAQLLTGRSLTELDEGDPEALERAALDLGLSRALPSLGRIGTALGLDELGVQSPGQQEGAVVAGRQLGRDVYLRYRYGLFEDFSGLELIYRISERFRLRTQTGTVQSIDVIYEVDPGDPDTLAEDVEDIDIAVQDPSVRPTEQVGPDVDAR